MCVDLEKTSERVPREGDRKMGDEEAGGGEMAGECMLALYEGSRTSVTVN